MLRRWKTGRGTLFDRRVFATTPSLRAAWAATGARAIIPVPQRFERAWRLGGSPALALSRWVAREIGATVVPALAPAPGKRGPRQATLARDARLSSPLRFDVAGAPPRGPVLLVDDFMTTGHTLRAAARALRIAGIGPVHAFCLGCRPEFVWKEETSDRRMGFAGSLAG